MSVGRGRQGREREGEEKREVGEKVTTARKMYGFSLSLSLSLSL